MQEAALGSLVFVFFIGIGFFERPGPLRLRRCAVDKDPRSEGRSGSSGFEGIASLKPGTMITEAELAAIVGKCTASIKRAVERGELPPPVHFCGVPAWTVDALVRHLDANLEEAKRESEAKKSWAGRKIVLNSS